MIARPSGRRAGAVEVALTALLVALTVFTALVVAVPSVHPALVNDRLGVIVCVPLSERAADSCRRRSSASTK